MIKRVNGGAASAENLRRAGKRPRPIAYFLLGVVLVITAIVSRKLLYRSNFPPLDGPQMNDSAAQLPPDPPQFDSNAIPSLRSGRTKLVAAVNMNASRNPAREAVSAEAYGDLWLAEHILTKAGALSGSSPSLQLALAANLRSQMRVGDAIAVCKQVLASRPNEMNAYIGIADGYFAENHRPDAFSWLTLALASGSPTAGNMTIIAHRYQDWKDYPTAVKVAQAAMKQFPGDTDPALQCASAQAEGGDLDDARATVEPIVAAHPNDEFATRVLGVVLMNPAYRHRDINRARTLLEHAGELDPKDIAVYRSLAAVYRELHLNRLAAQCYYAVLLLQPSSADARYGLGQTYALLGMPVQSRTQLDLYKILTERDRRIAVLSEAAYNHALSAEPHAQLARFDESIGLYADAVSQFEIACNLAPANAGYFAELRGLFDRLGWGEPVRDIQRWRDSEGSAASVRN